MQSSCKPRLRLTARSTIAPLLLTAIINRAEQIDTTVNPFADKYFDQAMARANKSEERYRKGNPRRLEGLPLLVKDASAIKGTRATVGSLMNADSIDQHSSFDPYVNLGPITRTIADAALMQNVMSGPHSLDHNSLRNKLNIPQNLGDVKGMKIACSMDLGHYLVVDDVRRETLATLDVLRDAGAEITLIDIDWASEAIRLAHMSEEFIFTGVLQQALQNHADEMSDYVPQLYETASAVTADDYRRCLSVAGAVWHDHMGPLFKKYDALITPGVSCPEVPAENWQKDVLVVNGQEITDTDTAMTALFNMFNRCPVLSVPAGMTDKGLPVGVQIVGRPYDDITTFQINRAIETNRPWSHRRPALPNN